MEGIKQRISKYSPFGKKNQHTAEDQLSGGNSRTSRSQMLQNAPLPESGAVSKKHRLSPRARRSVTFSSENTSSKGKNSQISVASTSNDSLEEVEDSFLCQFCDKTGNDTMIECEACERWSCLPCQNMSLEMHSIFTDETNGAHWFCKDCEGRAIQAAKLAAKNLTVTPLAEKAESQITENITERIGKLLQEVEQSVKDMVTSGEKRLKDTYTDITRKGIPQQVSENQMVIHTNDNSQEEGIRNVVSMLTMDEMIDRERCKNNIVLYNVTESKANTFQGRQDDDMKQLADIFEQGVEIGEVKINKTVRLGGVNQNR